MDGTRNGSLFGKGMGRHATLLRRGDDASSNSGTFSKKEDTSGLEGSVISVKAVVAMDQPVLLRCALNSEVQLSFVSRLSICGSPRTSLLVRITGDPVSGKALAARSVVTEASALGLPGCSVDGGLSQVGACGVAEDDACLAMGSVVGARVSRSSISMEESEWVGQLSQSGPCLTERMY